MEVVILSGADADLDDIYARLEENERGDDFLAAVRRQLELLRTFPKLHRPELARKVRKVRLGRFPYGLFYTLEARRLFIVAVQDLRQDPSALARLILSRL